MRSRYLWRRYQFHKNVLIIIVSVVVVWKVSWYFCSLEIFENTGKSSGYNDTKGLLNNYTLSRGNEDELSNFNLQPKEFPRPYFNQTPFKVLDDKEIANIPAEIKQRNSQQLISNLDKFGEVNDSIPVLLVQVHTRLENLKILITSLSYVREIENSLLIFSHDVFSPEINKVIEQINFTRVLQIFYPHSIQLHPHRFPGQGINDCAKKLSAQKAKEIQCENWKHPDMYGNYRDALYTQAKHHWWWKANFVFNHVTALENHTGLVALLEEDQYASPDLLWMLNLMGISMRENRCSGCSLFELGQHQVDIFATRWDDPSFYSRTSFTKVHTAYIMAFNRTFWESVEKCTLEFCSYDDYNWDFSLKSAFRNCFTRPVITLQTEFPRVFHNGECNGMHQHLAPDGCNIAQNAGKIRRTIEILIKHNLLFPQSLGIVSYAEAVFTAPAGNGGWNDIIRRSLGLGIVSDAEAVSTRNGGWNGLIRESLGIASDIEVVNYAFKRNGGWGDVRDKTLCISFSKMFAGGLNTKYCR